MNEIEILKAKQGIISELLDTLSSRLRGILYSYEVVGKEDEQSVDWRTKEPQWEDNEHTIPLYRNKYDWVKKTELTEAEDAEATLVREIAKKIAKM